MSLGTQAEKAMAPHSSTLAWKIPWTQCRGPGVPTLVREVDSAHSDQDPSVFLE